MIFPYGEKELEYLKKKDKRLKAAIERIGIIERGIQPDAFAALVESIISQQISSKAAETVEGRVRGLAGEITAKSLLALGQDALQKCGMSMRKAEYIHGISEAAASGQIAFDNLSLLSDDDIIKKLTALRGVGRWTVEMLLIFSFMRPDVVSYDDLAIRRGIMRLYGHNELTKAQFEKYRKRYSPYGTVASLYLWAISAE